MNTQSAWRFILFGCGWALASASGCGSSSETESDNAVLVAPAASTNEPVEQPMAPAGMLESPTAEVQPVGEMQPPETGQNMPVSSDDNQPDETSADPESTPQDSADDGEMPPPAADAPPPPADAQPPQPEPMMDMTPEETDSAPSPEGEDTTEMPADAMESDEAVERPNYPMGPNDRVAQRACALLDGPADVLEIVDVEADAGQVLITPRPEIGYTVTIPDSGTGFLTLEIPDWAVVIANISSFQQTITVLDPDGVMEERVPLSWNGACPDKGLTDHRFHYHSWGAFTVRVDGAPNSEMALTFIKEN